MMMAQSKSVMKLCATCLALSSFEFPVTENIKGILRSLLHDSDIDEFFQSIPKDTQLKLCGSCNHTLSDIMVFKVLAQNSFNLLKKSWNAEMPNQTTMNAAAFASSSQTENYPLLHTIKIEDQKELKCEWPDPLDSESIIKSGNNVYDTFIDIKEEYDPDLLNQSKQLDISPVIKQEALANNNAATSRIESFNHDFENNKLMTQTNNIVNHNIAPVEFNNFATSSNNFVNNKVPAITVDNLNYSFVTHNVPVPKNEKFNHKCVPIVYKLVQAQSNEKCNRNFVTTPINNKFNQTFVLAQNNMVSAQSNYTFNPTFANDNVVTPCKNKVSDIKFVVQMPSVAVTTFENLRNDGPNPNIDNAQNVIDGGALPASDTESEGKFPSNNEGRMKKDTEESGSAVKLKTSSDNGQKKWYLNVLSREQVLTKMEELRNHPDFLKAPHKCVACVTLFFNESLLEKHKEEFHVEGSEFTCFACQTTFKDLKALKCHYREHTVAMNVYYCTTCEFETRDFKCIRKHVCPNAGSKLLPPKDPTTMRLSKCGSLYYCPKCEYVTTVGRSLLLHYDVQHKPNPKVKCDECGNLYNKGSLNQHMYLMHKGKKPQREPIFCNICNKWLSYKQTYYSHMRNKHPPDEQLKYQCDECEKKFLTPRLLKNHKDLHEIMKGGKNYRCDVCGRAYYTERLLRKHKVGHRKKILASRDHVCEVCGMAFFSNRVLQKHMAKHSDERPHKCTHCGDTFKYYASLYTHTKLKHEKNKNSKESTQKRKEQGKRRKEKNKDS